MTELIRTLKGNLTILLVEHDMDVVFSLADKVTVLVYGRDIATGPPDDIREDPATGSAAAALTGMLADMQEGQAPNVRRWRIEQGVEMGRASRILSETDARTNGQQRVRIGGDLQLLVGEEKQSALFRPQPTEAIAVRLGL